MGTTATVVTTTTALTTTAPQPLYPLPFENLFNVRYDATASHWWVFSNNAAGALATDKGAKSNFLTSSLQQRTDLPSTLPTASGSVFFTALNIPGPLNNQISFSQGLDSTDSPSLNLAGNGACLQLAILSQEHPYPKACLEAPEMCEYGFSGSVWMKFTSDNFKSNEILIATAPGSNQGFIFSFQRGNLLLVVTGRTSRWTASIPMSKSVGQWRNLAFSWIRYTGDITFNVDDKSAIIPGATTKSAYPTSLPPATSIYLGCTTGPTGTPDPLTSTAMIVTHPVLWLWPIQNQLLYSGGLVYRLVTINLPAPTAPPPPTPPPGFDYSTVVNEMAFATTTDNPYYTVADEYVSLQTAPNPPAVGVSVVRADRNRMAFSIGAPAAFATVKSYGTTGCIGAYALCSDGISMSVWVMVPSSSPTGPAVSDIMEIAGWSRLFFVYEYFVIWMNNTGSDQYYQFDKPVVRGVWTNLAFTVDTNGNFQFYNNSNPTTATNVNYAYVGGLPRLIKLGCNPGDLVVGTAAASGVALVNAQINDIVIWRRYLFPFERHRFVGYTATQHSLLRNSALYYTTDPYVNADAPSLLGPSGVSTATNHLASMYKPRVYNFPSTELDYEKKSQAPVFLLTIYDQVMLGQSKKSVPTKTDIAWVGHCFTDPNGAPCRGNGITISMWLKIKSVSPTKLRFYLNSGDLGDAFNPQMDSRGIAIFTDTQLLGVSISTMMNQWTIVIDSNRYDLDQWINIGMTWRQDLGLRFFLNGIDYGLWNSYPDNRFKQNDPHYRVVVGRLDDDDNTTWAGTSQAVWEMANFVLGDIAYFDHYMELGEYAGSLMLSTNVFYKSAVHYLEKQGLINQPYSVLSHAKSQGVSLGPTGPVQFSSNGLSARLLGGKLKLKYLPASRCPSSLTVCSSGLSAGGWFNITVSSQSWASPIRLFSSCDWSGGLEGFGLNMSANGTVLMGWARNGNSLWQVNAAVVLVPKWTHLGLIWSVLGGLQILVNGVVVAQSGAGVQFRATGNGTLMVVGDSLPAGAVIEVYNFAIYNSSLEATQLTLLVGMKSSQMALMAIASDYWTFSGVYKDINPTAVNLFSTTYSADKFGEANAAVCTGGFPGSYVSLNQLTNCLTDTTNCSSFVLTINMQMLSYPTDSSIRYLFYAGGLPQQLGMNIQVSASGLFTFVTSNATFTCTNTVTYNSTDWFQMQLLWYSSKPPSVKIDGQVVATSTSGNCTPASNTAGNASDIRLGQNLFVCLSDVMAMYLPSNKDPDLASSGTVDTSCYVNPDIRYSLAVNQANYKGLNNQASNLQPPTAISMLPQCITNPGLCSKGLTLSLWINLTSSGQTAYILNSGRPGRGVSFKVVPSTDDSTYYNLVIEVHNGDALWNVTVNKGIKVNQWTNIAFTWNSQTGLSSFINGLISQRTSVSTPSPQDAPNAKATVFIGRHDASDTALAVGLVSDLTAWYSVIVTCQNPQQSAKLLRGSCQADVTLPTVAQCANLGSCVIASGILCLDATVDNIISMSQMTLKITSATDANNILTLAVQVMQGNSAYYNLTKATASLLLNVITNLVIPSTLTSNSLASVTVPILAAASELLNSRYTSTWKTLQQNLESHPIKVISMVDTFMTRLARNIQTSCTGVTSPSAQIVSSSVRVNPSCTGSAKQIPFYSDPAWNNVVSQWNQQPCSDTFQIGSSSLAANDMLVTGSVYNSAPDVIPGIASSQTRSVNGSDTLVDFLVNSRIISVIVEPPLTINLNDQSTWVNFTMPLRNPNQPQLPPQKWKTVDPTNMQYIYEVRCTFWNTTHPESADGFGLWDNFGCILTGQNGTHVSCSCSHLTSFAILMQPVPPASNNINDRILSVLTYIGLSISLLSLLVFLFILCFKQQLSGERYVIHINLCLALFIAQLAFILNEPAQYNKSFCQAVGVIMHLFFTAGFTWLLVEALFAFYAVTAGVLRGRLKCYMPFAWGLPIVIVATTAGLSIESYGQDRICWLSSANYFLWAFLGPVVALILATMLVCGIVLCNIGTPAIKKAEIMVELREHTRQTTVLVPLMLIAWLFGILLIVVYSYPIAYIFVIFNSLQGLWVFLCFGVGNPAIRDIICRRYQSPASRPSAVGSLNSMGQHLGEPGSLSSGSYPPGWDIGRRPPSPPPMAPVYYANSAAIAKSDAHGVKGSMTSISSRRGLLNDDQCSRPSSAASSRNKIHPMEVPDSPQKHPIPE